MRIGIIGAGRIGGGIARQLEAAGHEVKLSFSRDPATLDELATAIGPNASVGTTAEAVEFFEVVVPPTLPLSSRQSAHDVLSPQPALLASDCGGAAGPRVQGSSQEPRAAGAPTDGG